MKLSSVYLLSFLFLGIMNIAWGQQKRSVIERRGDRYLSEAFDVQPGQVYSVSPGFPFTSVFVRCSSCPSFAKAAVVALQDTFLLKTDPHAPTDLGLQSHLIVFPHEIDAFTLFAGNLEGDVTLVYLNAVGEKGQPANKRLHKPEVQPDDNCGVPEVIGQEVWRAGLGPPSYTRSFSQVSHLIVHHSATSNHLQDYTNVVRNIYLLHTEGNGWSDVGYNYLVAPDGTIFAGRDPGNGEQDNVVGAHFCGKNSSTMGICLLGEYGSVQPSEAMMSALRQLLAWKASKNALDPLAAFVHPANNQLGVVAGHRDGCSTECPGDNVYALLPKTRQEVAAFIQSDCQPKEQFLLSPNPTADVFSVPTTDFASFRWQCYDMRGRQVKLDFVTIANSEVSFSVRHLPAGVYIVRFQETGQSFERKLVVL